MSSKAIWKIQMTASKNALSFMIFLMTTGCTNVFASQNKQEKIDRDAIYLKILDRKSDLWHDVKDGSAALFLGGLVSIGIGIKQYWSSHGMKNRGLRPIAFGLLATTPLLWFVNDLKQEVNQKIQKRNISLE